MPEPSRHTPRRHTIVLSDLHLSDAEPLDRRRPLWKRFKRRDLFVDAEFARLLERLTEELTEPAELVLNGDVFDFDSVMQVPYEPRFPVSWLERRRGLAPEQQKSAFKMKLVLGDHPIFLEALRDWMSAGHDVVFVIGNHDLELHWPAVQTLLRDALEPPERPDALRICEWFYVSSDALITHGNQFDRYCVCQDPVHPTINIAGRARVRSPFGNLSSKLLLNGMGLFNPHVEDSFIMSLRQYVAFFFRYIMRIQPLLALTWFWTSVATLIVLLREGFRPALKDPLTVEDRVECIASRARVSPGVVRSLRAVDVHSAAFNPWMVARELWLDRALLLLIVAGVSWQFFSTMHVFAGVSAWWLFAAAAVMTPPLVYYSRAVSSDLDKVERTIAKRLPLLARIAEVKCVVMGHTHVERHTVIEGVEYLNTGSWSPAFRDVECTQPYGRRCFAWIRPDEQGSDEQRSAVLYEWKEPDFVVIEPVEHAAPAGRHLLPGPLVERLKGRGAKAGEPAKRAQSSEVVM